MGVKMNLQIMQHFVKLSLDVYGANGIILKEIKCSHNVLT